MTKTLLDFYGRTPDEASQIVYCEGLIREESSEVRLVPGHASWSALRNAEK